MRKIRIQFILGKPGTGKTTHCHNEIAARQDAGGEGALVLLVPEQFSFQSEKALIAATGGRGLWRAQVLSFHRLSYYVFGRTGGIDKKILEDAGKHMLLRKIVGENARRMAYFRSGQDKRGFIDALASSITEFYQYNIAPDEILARAEAQTAENLRLKLLDLHLIYTEYKKYLEKEYISSDEILDILAEKIREADFLRGAEIWIDGFKSFTPQEKGVLAALFCVAASVKITLTVNAPAKRQTSAADKFDAFFEAKETMRQIGEMAEGLGAELVAPIFLETPRRYGAAPDIAFLCANFLGFADARYEEKPRNIRIFAAENIFAEIDAAAKIVTMLTRDRGLRYCEIGIVTANLGQYEKYVPAIFSQYNIPVFMDSRREILSHPLTESIFAALEVVASNWQYEAVFRLLRNAAAPIAADDVDLLENYVLAYNIRGRAWQEDFAYGPDEERAAANAVRANVLRLLAPLAGLSHNRSKKKHTVAEIAAHVYYFLEKNGAAAILADWIADARLRGDNEALRRHEQIWGKIMATLDKLVEILGGATESVGNFAKIFEAGMADLGIAPPSLDALVVGDLRRSRFGELAALIVLGANEGLMPSRPEPSGLLDDTDRSNLALDGMNLAKDYIAKIYEEEFLIYANFAKPREYLAISYRSGDLEGGGASPTRLLERLTELFPQISTIHVDKISWDSVAQIAAPHTVFSDMAAHLGSADASMPSIYSHAYDFFRQSPEFAAKLRHLEAAAAFAAQDKSAHLSRGAAKSLFGRHLRSSVSKLERFINCPFSYFMEYNLAARPRRLYEATAVDMGNIYHDILAQFGAALQKVDNSRDLGDAEVAEIIEQAINHTLAKPENQILESSGKYRHYSQKMRQISRISAEALVRHLQQGDFIPAFNEVAFSDFGDRHAESGLSFGAIEIPLGEGDGGATMHLDGRIDRVDLGAIGDNEFVKIIDYKSGRRRFSLSEAFHGLDMQLLVYLHSFIEKLAEARGPDYARKILPAAAFYFNLINPIVAYESAFAKDPESIKREILRGFKMSGIVLEDAAVIYAMDRDLAANSHILPVSLKKGSTAEAPLFKKESATISSEGFFVLMTHIMGVAQAAGRDILDGNIAIKPAKHRDNYPCRYCDYRPICKFDAAQGHEYRHLQHMRSDEVVARLLPEKG